MSSKSFTRKDLMDLTVLKLKEIAKSKDIPLTARSKNELVENILKALKQEKGTKVTFEDLRKLTKNTTFTCKVGSIKYVVENNKSVKDKQHSVKEKENVLGSVNPVDEKIIELFENLYDDENNIYNMTNAFVDISTSNDNLQVEFNESGIDIMPDCDFRKNYAPNKTQIIVQALDCIQSKIKPSYKITITGYPNKILSLKYQKEWSIAVLKIFVLFFRDFCGVNSNNITLNWIPRS
jgi:hypothetical protein